MQREFSTYLRRLLPRKGVLICFAGLDGSGKTTHAKSLCDYLSKQGYSYRYSWVVIRPVLFSYFLYAFTWFLRYWQKEQTGDESEINPLGRAPKNIRKALEPFLVYSIFLDFQINVLVKIRIPLSFGKIVISDRCVYDFMVSLMTSSLLTKLLIKLFLQATPTSNLTFVLDAPEELLVSRRPISIDYFRSNRQKYLLLARLLNLPVLCTADDFAKNQKEIRKKVISYLQDVVRYKREIL